MKNNSKSYKIDTKCILLAIVLLIQQLNTALIMTSCTKKCSGSLEECMGPREEHGIIFRIKVHKRKLNCQLSTKC